MPALTTLARSRIPLLALGALAMLLAAAIAALAPAAAAPPPSDLALTLSLVEDSDNIIAPGTSVRVRATLSHEHAQLGEFTVLGGSLRLSGGRDWESTGRTLLTVNADTLAGQNVNNIPPYTRAGNNAALGGAAVAVKARSAADGGDVVVVGYPKANVDGMRNAGAVDVFINGKFLQRITAGADAHVDAEFGTSVAVNGAGNNSENLIIAVGAPQDGVDECPAGISYWGCSRGNDAPGRNPEGAPSHPGQGAVYLFKLTDEEDLVERAARLAPTAFVPQPSPPNPADANARQLHSILKFGAGVAIGDSGQYIAISGAPALLEPQDGTAYADRWDTVAGWVFRRPQGGTNNKHTWIDMTIADLMHVSPLNAGMYAGDQHWEGAGIAFSGDETTIAIGHPLADYPFGANPTKRNLGAVSVFEVPTGGWTKVTSTLVPQRILRAARLTVGQDIVPISSAECLYLGQSVALSHTGNVVVAGAGGYPQLQGRQCVDESRHGRINPWAGAAVVWVDTWTSGAEANDHESDAVLTSSATSHANDRFGNSVAINNDGNTIAVTGGVFKLRSSDGANSVFEPGTAHIYYSSSWGDATTSTMVINAPRNTPNALFGARAGIALDGDTLIVGQSEAPHSSYLPGGAAPANILLYQGVGTGRAWSFDLDGVDLNDGADLTERTAVQDSAAELSSAQGCAARTLDDATTWTCVIALPDTEIVIPEGTPEGKFTISGTFRVDDGDDDADTPSRVLTDELEVTIGTVTEVANVEFGLAEDPGDPTTSDDDRTFPSVLAKRGDRTTLQLSVTNSGGGGASANSIASVLITANRGRLSTTIGGGCSGGDGGLSCQVPVSALTAANSGNIRIAIEHPGTPGTAEVRASVQPRIGEIVEPEAVTVVFAGPAETIEVGAPRTSVLNVDTPDAGDENVADEDVDNRDLMTLSVTAADAGGNKVEVPNAANGRVVIRNAEGRVVYSEATRSSSNFSVAWPKPYSGPAAAAPADGFARDGEGNLLLEVNVNADPGSPLATGQYALTLSAASKTFTRNFTVTGGAATLAFDKVEGSTARGGTFSVIATVLDADGTPVPDGTPVRWADGSTSRTAIVVQLSTVNATTDGKASASYLVVGQGNAWVRATAAPATDVKLLSVGHMEREERPAEGLTNPRPNDFTTWIGDAMVYASDILGDIDNEQITAILLWQNGKWLRYAVSEGQVVPGSMDFHVDPGVVLWLGG